MRNRRANNYRKTAYLVQLSGTSLKVGSTVTVAIPDFDTNNPLMFKYRDSEGKGLSKNQYFLFQNWVMQAGNGALETNSDMEFNKGDRIEINGEVAGLIETVMIVNTNQSNNLRGNKKDHNQTKVVLYG